MGLKEQKNFRYIPTGDLEQKLAALIQTQLTASFALAHARTIIKTLNKKAPN
jgi:hypothetical protein